LDDRRVDDREELLRYGPADRKEARAKPAGRDNAVADRPDSAVPVAHCRASALSVKLVGWVVRTANPVTARSGGRRSALVSMSRVSCPFSTACRSTVWRSPKRRSEERRVGKEHRMGGAVNE